MSKSSFVDFPGEGPGREFHYISAMPGAGKTEYFVQRAVEYIRRNKSNMPIIYAAPTIQLLVEAQKRIFKELKTPQHRNAAVIIVSSSTDELKQEKEAHYFVEPPANAMNYMLGLVGEVEYARSAKLRAGQKLNLVGRNRNQYKVLLITHEAFVKIARVAEPKDYPRLASTTVFFDEARQCIAKEVELHSKAVTPADIRHLGNVLRFQYATEANSVKSRDGKERKFGYFNVVGMVPNKKAIAKEFGVSKYLEVSAPVRRFLQKLAETCASGRNVMTVKLETKFSKGKWLPDFSNTAFVPFTVMRPTELFSGYHHVVLMSAMFKDSQMWKILNASSKHSFIDMLSEDSIYYAPPGVKGALKSILKRHEKNLDVIQERLRCIPLTAANTDALSLTYLNTSCMLPMGLDARLAKAAEYATDKEKRVDLIKSVVNGVTVFGDKELSKELHEYAVPPLWVAMRAAYRALKEAGCTEALLFINTKKNSRVWEPAQINYIDMVRDALKHEEGGDEHLTTEESRQGGCIDPRWMKWLHAVCHGRGKFFLAPRTTSVRGLNVYKHHTGYVHLAALNQEPDMYEFCERTLPTYNVDLDNVIDNVLQTLYRTNLREPDSKEKIYMVTSNSYAIDQLAKKVFRNSTKKFKLLAGYKPELTTLSYRGKSGSNSEAGKKRQSDAGKKNRKYSVELGKEIAKARVALANAKSNLKKVEWRTKLEGLLKKAAVEKDMSTARVILGN